MIPVTEEKPAESYEVLLNELTQYNEQLLKKPRLIALSKIDLLSSEQEIKDLVKETKEGING